MYIRDRFVNPARGIGWARAELGQVPNPDNMPTKPITPDKDPIPTDPVVPQKWCPQLPKIQSNICFSYASQEIAISKTEAGHLTPDVVLLPQIVLPNPSMPNTVLSCQYLVIRDFGVDWRHVKLSTRNEQLFKDSLTRFETDTSLAFRIVGYSDCVGVENNNLFLRNGRARNIFNLLGTSARSRVLAVTVAPQGTYLTDNSTIAARASTRAVVIEIFMNGVGVI
jgi:hypothetical protein